MDDKNTMAAAEKMPFPYNPDVEKDLASEERRRSVPIKVAKHANDADEAMKAFAGDEGEVLVLDEATSKRLLRRIDLHLMPVRNPAATRIGEIQLTKHSFYVSSMASIILTVRFKCMEKSRQNIDIRQRRPYHTQAS